VTEEGTEAVAATGVILGPFSATPIVLPVSVPFIPSFPLSSTAKPMVFSSVADFPLHKAIIM
jgi:hypothetical protein